MTSAGRSVVVIVFLIGILTAFYPRLWWLISKKIRRTFGADKNHNEPNGTGYLIVRMCGIVVILISGISLIFKWN